MAGQVRVHTASARVYNMLVVVLCVWCLTAIAVRERLAEIAISPQTPAHLWSLLKTFVVLYGIAIGKHALGSDAFRRRATAHCALLMVSLFAGFILDRVALIPARLRGRYQIIHCLGNIVVAALAWDDAVNAFMRPSNALHGDSNLSPYTVALAIHAYHVLAFRPLPAADWKHHLLMIGGTLPIVAWFPSGRLTGLSLFAACGAPGAITYGAIALRKNEYLSRLEEKRINAAVNTWFRGPLVTISGYVVFVATWDRPAPMSQWAPTAVGTCISLLIFWNGQFYGRQVVENYGSCIMQGRPGTFVPPPTVC